MLFRRSDEIMENYQITDHIHLGIIRFEKGYYEN